MPSLPPDPRRSSRLASLAGLAASLLFLGACGGDDFDFTGLNRKAIRPGIVEGFVRDLDAPGTPILPNVQVELTPETRTVRTDASGFYLFDNLPPGDYTILVQDANGCETTASATILEPEVFEVMVEPQVTIKLGGSYQIETTVSVPLSDLSLIQWTPPLGLDCDTCLNPLASPLQTTRYRITVISNKGCEDDASLLLVVDRRPNVYIPNAFSPNGDGDNDLFKIYADPISVKQVKTFQVFSRWGELVYEYYNFDPNSPAYGWDGTLRGQQLNPAVFAYYAVIEFIDGQEILYEGDVTIVR